MTPSQVRAAARQLTDLHERFAPLFGRREAQQQSRVYLGGLLLAEGRKSAEPMALTFGTPGDDGVDQNQVLALQRFLTASPWEAVAVQREIQAVFAQRLAPSAEQWPLGTVGVLDDSGFPKKGDHRVGVARQYCGRLGKTDNCQVGVFLVGVVPAGTALLEHQLYLPKPWAKAKTRRQKARVPKGVTFRTKPQLAAELLRRVRNAGHIALDWVIADEAYGQNGGLLDEPEAQGQRYVMEVPATTTVWTTDPARSVPPYTGQGRPPSRPTREAVQSVKAIAASLPAGAWQALQVREGAKGPLVFAFARLRVWAVRHRKPGPTLWLLLRRSLGPEAEVKYYLCQASAEEPLGTMALVTGVRYRVEEFFQEGKSYLGMAQYEARAWTSWHHHMSLVGLAHLFVTLPRQRLKKSPGSDAGHGLAAAEERAAANGVGGSRGHRHPGIPPGAQRHRLAVAS